MTFLPILQRRPGGANCHRFPLSCCDSDQGEEDGLCVGTAPSPLKDGRGPTFRVLLARTQETGQTGGMHCPKANTHALGPVRPTWACTQLKLWPLLAGGDPGQECEHV